MKQLFFVLIAMCLSLHTFSQERPNVILIMTDDQGYGDITSHGNLTLKTPNIDKIANEGARLDNFHVSPVCAPTRASLLTGRYHIRTGVVHVKENLDVLRSEELTVAELFKQNGYKTGYFGKWHNGYHYPNHPNGQGFDEFFGFLGGHFPNYFDPTLDHNSNEVKTKGFITDVLTDRAIDWIAENKDTPFFCYIPYNAPHTPCQVEDKYFDKYAAMGFDDKTASIYGMIENLDDNIGKLHQALSEMGIEENTILVFLTDNGPNTPERFNSGMKGHKTHVDEGGVRVPFFIKWKNKIPAGLLSKQLSAHIDVLPTLADLCDISIPENLELDGVNLSKYLLNDQQAHFDRTIYTHFYFGNKLQPKKGTARTHQYRYVLNPGGEGLYNMINDPGQERNIRDNKPKEFKELQEAYSNWFNDVSKNWKIENLIPVGFDAFPVCHLNAVEASLMGDIRFKGRGFVNDWIVNWVNTDDRIVWDVDFVDSGRYNFILEYQCPEEDLGAEVVLSIGNKSLKTTINIPFDAPLYPSLDRTPRAGEMQKPWGKIELGNLKIKKGETKVVLSANNKKGSQIIEVKRISIKKIN